MFIAFVWITFSTHFEFWELIGQITVEKIIALVLVFLIFCLMVNIYAIELLVEEWWKKRRIKKGKNQSSDLKINKEKRIKDMFKATSVTIAIEILIVFLIAYYTEYNRCAYKMIMIQSEMDSESKYVIEYGTNQNKYKMYPVTYENENCYIVTRLFNDNGKISIDYNYQKVIEKEGYETVYIQNIYDIGIAN